MTNEPDTPTAIARRTVFELGKVIVDCAAEAAGAVPVIGPLAQGGAEVVAWAVQRRNAALADDFFSRVARALDASTLEEATSEIRINLDEPWAHKTIADGFDALRGSFDDAATGCITAVVADYLKSQSVPDRFYRRAASLFQESNGDILQQLRHVSTLYVASVTSYPNAKGRYLTTIPSSSEGEGKKGEPPSWRDQNWSFHTRVTDSERHEAPTTHQSLHTATIVNLMTKHGFAVTWRGLGDSKIKGAVQLMFPSHGELEMRRFHKYLSAGLSA